MDRRSSKKEISKAHSLSEKWEINGKLQSPPRNSAPTRLHRVGDFGLLLGILGFYWITGSFEFQDLFEIFNNSKNEFILGG